MGIGRHLSLWPVPLPHGSSCPGSIQQQYSVLFSGLFWARRFSHNAQAWWQFTSLTRSCFCIGMLGWSQVTVASMGYTRSPSSSSTCPRNGLKRQTMTTVFAAWKMGEKNNLLAVAFLLQERFAFAFESTTLSGSPATSAVSQVGWGHNIWPVCDSGFICRARGATWGLHITPTHTFWT